MFVRLTKRTKFLGRVRLFNKPTDINELAAERFTNCSPNVWFVCSPNHTPSVLEMKFWNYFCLNVLRVKVPTGILGAEIDKMSPPELIKEFEAALVAKEVNSFVKIYPGVSHGWTIRYKDEDAAEVKCAQEAHQDLVEWFGKCL
ncbi:putative dienelactone hydrolase, alpha/Beta hydrolase [Helianthus annuus]|nr:putative dienelactone hydrolase, alpha/Beta hydrolase [Helianthus annuus]